MSRRFAGWAMLLLAATVAPAVAQDAPPAKVAGPWNFSFETPQGATTWKITFEQVADTLKGTAQSEFGELPLSGLVSGNDISFGVTLTFEGQSFDLMFSGKVSDKTAEGIIDVPAAGMQISWTAKRVEEGAAEEKRPRVPAD